MSDTPAESKPSSEKPLVPPPVPKLPRQAVLKESARDRAFSKKKTKDR